MINKLLSKIEITNKELLEEKMNVLLSDDYEYYIKIIINFNDLLKKYNSYFNNKFLVYIIDILYNEYTAHKFVSIIRKILLFEIDVPINLLKKTFQLLVNNNYNIFLYIINKYYIKYIRGNFEVLNKLIEIFPKYKSSILLFHITLNTQLFTSKDFIIDELNFFEDLFKNNIFIDYSYTIEILYVLYYIYYIRYNPKFITNNIVTEMSYISLLSLKKLKMINFIQSDDELQNIILYFTDYKFLLLYTSKWFYFLGIKQLFDSIIKSSNIKLYKYLTLINSIFNYINNDNYLFKINENINHINIQEIEIFSYLNINTNKKLMFKDILNDFIQKYIINYNNYYTGIFNKERHINEIVISYEYILDTKLKLYFPYKDRYIKVPVTNKLVPNKLLFNNLVYTNILYNNNHHSNTELCTICLENKINIIFIECNHAILCEKCLYYLIINNKLQNCPYCRKHLNISYYESVKPNFSCLMHIMNNDDLSSLSSEFKIIENKIALHGPYIEDINNIKTTIIKT